MHDFRINRRAFLTALGGTSLTLAAAASAPFSFAFSSRAPGSRKNQSRYFVATPSSYWKKQEMSKHLGAPSLVKFPKMSNFSEEQGYTILTAINDDGTNIKRVKLPYTYHCTTSGHDPNLIYLIGRGRPTALACLNIDSLELVNVIESPQTTDTRTFAGHGVALPGTNHMAFAMNYNKRGKYDSISIREADTFKEVEQFSTFGFQVHDLRLGSDGKYFVCGHYGSYLGHGVYEGMGIYSGHGGDYSINRHPEYVYPSSVTLVDTTKGERHRLLSDVDSGQEGHAEVDENYSVYLPNFPAFMRSLPNLEKHPRFKEGEYTKKDHGEFAATDSCLGINLAYDPKFKEIIVPKRDSLEIFITHTIKRDIRIINLQEITQSNKIDWLKPELYFLNGLALHPDEKHYILSTTQGFVALERGTHKLNPAMTFATPLLVHAHMHIV